MNTYSGWCDDCGETVDKRLHSHFNALPYGLLLVLIVGVSVLWVVLS